MKFYTCLPKKGGGGIKLQALLHSWTVVYLFI